jgi:FkbM family methyltransferase
MKDFILSLALRKRRYQNFFEKLYRLAVRGMNYGFGGGVHQSGEIEAIRYVAKRLGNEAVIFDVGANIGDYSKELLKHFESPIVYCFEPSKKTFTTLENNLKQLRGINFCNFGFGKVNETVELFSDRDASGLASLYNRRLDHLGIEMSLKEDIEIMRIDDFCEERNILDIDFLKLDIEGHELAALQGAKEMLNRGRIKYIQFEFGGCNIDSRTYFQDFWYLLNDRYAIYRIVKDGLTPIKEYRETYEIFSTINYLAELKHG